MKICSDQEALEAGFDPAAARVIGDSNYMEINLVFAHNEHKLGYPISVDRRIKALDARKIVPSAINTLKFQSKSLDDHCIKPKFLDVIEVNSFTPNGGVLLGFDYVVSEFARDKLLPYLKNECTFVPVEIADVPQQYYIMWVHHICDVVDEERSRLGEDELSPERKRPFRAVFHLNKIDSTYLFRVPQWKYDMDCDLALKPFRDLVKKLRISGFTFQAGGKFGPFLK